MVDAVRVSYRAAILCGVLSGTVFGQLVERTIELEPGWNSVFLEIDPAPDDADSLFADLPITTVWMRSRPPLVGGVPEDCSGPEDADCSPRDDTPWRVWVPEGDPNRPAIDLRSIRGNNVYLIKASGPGVLTIVGEPSPTSQKWRGGYNLVGFHVDL